MDGPERQDGRRARPGAGSGRPHALRGAADRLHADVCLAPQGSPHLDSGLGRGGGRLLGQRLVREQAAGQRAAGGHGTPPPPAADLECGGDPAGADRRRQPGLARRRLGLDPHLRAGHRRPAPRPVPAPDRPFPLVFRRPHARHAGRPHHRHRERDLHGREPVHLERAAADTRGAVLDRLHGRRPLVDRARPGGALGRALGAAVPAGGRRPRAAPPIRDRRRPG